MGGLVIGGRVRRLRPGGIGDRGKGETVSTVETD